MEYILTTENLGKQYRHFKALGGLNMHVPKGAVYGFVGRNGAGKTTLIRLICGLQEPTSGSFQLYGIRSTGQRIAKARRRIGAVVETPSIYLDMTAEDNLRQQYSVILSAQEPAPETVCLNSALEESIASFYAALTARGIRPQIHMSGKRIEMQLNREALGRVFSNLLSNALKYSDGDLEITLRDDGEILFSNAASDLNEIQVEKLFDRFFTVEAARNSTGLGLSIARTLVERMGGTIHADFRKGRLNIALRFG